MENKDKTETASVQSSEDRLSLLKSRLNVAKQWAKKPHEAWKRYIAEYEISDSNDLTEVKSQIEGRDKVRIGYIFRKTEEEIPAIFDDQPEIFIKGRTKDYQVIEDIYNSAYDLLWDKQNLEEKIEDAGVYFELLGMAFISSPYEVKTKKIQEEVQTPVIDEATGQPAFDETGAPAMKTEIQEYEVPTYDMPMASVEDPFKIYFSPETKFNAVMDQDHCPYYFKEMSWTKEKIKSRFGVDVDPDEKMLVNDPDADSSVTDAMDKSDSPTVKDDFKRSTVYEYYGSLPEELAKGIGGSEWDYDKEYHVFFTKGKELKIEECPYTVKPLFVLGNYGLANKFWKFGDAKHLMPLVQELEQYRTQILNHTRKMANPKPLIELNSEVDEQAFSDPRVGKPVKFSNTPPTYLSPANLGREVEIGVNMARIDLEKTAPSFDLAGGGNQSEVKTPRGIQVFSEAADRGVRRKRKKVARLIRQLIIFQFNQLALNWKPDESKSLSIGGKEEPVSAEILQVLGDPTLLDKVDIEVESLSLNRVQMKQDALDLLDTALQSEAARPGILNLELIWRDVLQNGFHKRDADRYILPAEQQQAMQQAGSQPKVSVSVRADSQTPAGIQLLQNQNLLNPQQAQQDINEQQMQQIQDHQTQVLAAANKPVAPMQSSSSAPAPAKSEGMFSKMRNALFVPKGGGQ